MQNPNTMYRIELVLAKETSQEVLDVLKFLLAKQRTRLNMQVAIPNHPFFFTDGWMRLFEHHLTASLRRRAGGGWQFRVVGDTNGEEQDIGLFLRWLLPDIKDTNRPRRLAAVRNRARRQVSSINYFICKGALNVELVDDPIHALTNFHLRAAA